jgi:hypothetical protein
MTLSLPNPVRSGVFVGCNVWDWNITLDGALQIAYDNDLTVEDSGEVIWFEDAKGDCVAYWRPLND